MINNSNVLVAHTKQAKWVNRVARNFLLEFILRIGDFFCFGETNSCD